MVNDLFVLFSRDVFSGVVLLSRVGFNRDACQCVVGLSGADCSESDPCAGRDCLNGRCIASGNGEYLFYHIQSYIIMYIATLICDFVVF